MGLGSSGFGSAHWGDGTPAVAIRADRFQLPIAPRLVYIMRGFRALSPGYIYWEILGAADPTAVLAPFPLSELSDIVVHKRFRR
jgi:hypothetical protein